MPIEFRCTQCNKLLRTGDDTVGKQARCPECGAVMAVPAPAPASGSPFDPTAAPQPSVPPAPVASPFAEPPRDSTNPYQSPAGLALEPQSFAPRGEIRPTQIEFGATLTRTWQIFGDNWLAMLGALILIFIINVAVSFAMQGVIAGIGAAVNDATVAGVAGFFIQVVFQVFAMWLGIGLNMFTLALVRGEQPSMGMLFAGGRFLLPIILCALLVGVVVLLGLVLLIIPGIIFAMMLMQAQLLIIDRNMGVLDAMSTSREVMAGNKLTVFGIGFVAGLLGILLTVLTCGLGYLAFGPYMMILSVVIYLGVTGQPTQADAYFQAGGPTYGQPGGTPFGPTPPGQAPFGPTTPGSGQGGSPFGS
ncbi:MAG: zinc ribbon domain-containing protein [Thermoguttaceae bacterium]